MNRRNFLKLTIGGVAAGAAVRTWPFRVYSFPTEVSKYSWSKMVDLNIVTLRELEGLDFPDLIFTSTPIYKYLTRNRQWPLAEKKLS